MPKQFKDEIPGIQRSINSIKYELERNLLDDFVNKVKRVIFEPGFTFTSSIFNTLMLL